MSKFNRRSILLTIFAMTLASLPSLGMPPQSDADAAPVPALILSARSVFVSNAGNGCNPFGRVLYGPGPNQTYSRFYAALKGWGKYQLAAAPADSDLVFQISFTCPVSQMGATHNDDPQLNLVILDVKTHITLWAVTEHMRPEWRKLDKNFDELMSRLVTDLKQLAAGVSLPTASVKSKP